MATSQRQPTDAEMRLITLFREIDDVDVREVIANVVAIERQYRTGSRKNFPMKEVRNVIDRVARFQESES